MKKVFPTVKHERVMEGATDIMFIPFQHVPSEFGTEMYISVADLGSSGCAFRLQTVIVDDDTVELQSESILPAPTLRLVESDKDGKLYIYDEGKKNTKTIDSMLEDGDAKYDDLPEINETENEEPENDSIANRIDNMQFNVVGEPEGEPDEDDLFDGDEEGDSLEKELLDANAADESEDEPEPDDNDAKDIPEATPPDESEESKKVEEYENALLTGEKDTPKNNDESEKDLAERLRDAGFRTTVKDNDKKITYIGAPENRTSAQKPYNDRRGKNNKRDKFNNRNNKRDGKSNGKQLPTVNRDIDFDSIGDDIFD